MLIFSEANVNDLRARLGANYPANAPADDWNVVFDFPFDSDATPRHALLLVNPARDMGQVGTARVLKLLDGRSAEVPAKFVDARINGPVQWKGKLGTMSFELTFVLNKADVVESLTNHDDYSGIITTHQSTVVIKFVKSNLAFMLGSQSSSHLDMLTDEMLPLLRWHAGVAVFNRKYDHAKEDPADQPGVEPEFTLFNSIVVDRIQGVLAAGVRVSIGWEAQRFHDGAKMYGMIDTAEPANTETHVALPKGKNVLSMKDDHCVNLLELNGKSANDLKKTAKGGDVYFYILGPGLAQSKLVHCTDAAANEAELDKMLPAGSLRDSGTYVPFALSKEEVDNFYALHSNPFCI